MRHPKSDAGGDGKLIMAITNDWNQLPATVVASNSINTLKSLLEINLIDLRFISPK